MEDQNSYGRLATLFTKCQSTEKILEQASLQLGAVTAMTATGGAAPFPVTPQLFSVDQIKPQKIPAGEKRRVCFRLTMSSVFAGSEKCLPLWAMNGGFRVQATLSNAADVVKVNDATNNPTQSNTFELSAAVLLADYVTLDSALQEKCFASLAAGNALLYESSQFSSAEVFLAASVN